MFTGSPEGYFLQKADSLPTCMAEEGAGGMKQIITRINRTLFELLVGICLFGLICQLFVVLVSDKQGYSLGLWMGILIAGVSAVHMWWSLDRALDLGEKQAVRFMTTHNILRYLFIVAAFMLIIVRQAGNPLAAFLGIMGLKASAYMHFITKRISRLIYGEEILPDLIEESDRE